MDFQFPPSAEAFRTELREFLDEELPDWWNRLFVDDERIFPFTRQLCAKLARRGWLTAAWPTEYGGAAADEWTQIVVREEMWAAGEPRGPQYMNLNYIGPMIMKFGTAEQQERFLTPMAAGDVIWCQGFSEPQSGSDLASLATEAIDDGSHLVVNGRKIWISYAAEAEWCVLLARTDPASTRFKGLSMLLVDMRTPGITVRPIETMVGPTEFNEVVFENVVVPYDCVLGPRDAGWSVAMYGLTFERIGIAFHASLKVVLDTLIAYVRTTEDANGRPLAERPSVRAGLARLHARYRAARLLGYRVISAQEAGTARDMDPAIYKVFATEAYRFAGELALDVAGAKGQLTEGDPLAPAGGLFKHWLHTLPGLIGAGTNEIQRNIISQRGLGLPR